jgi:hypothetical protein
MQGFVTSYGGLVTCRVVLGLAEGGLLAGSEFAEPLPPSPLSLSLPDGR